LSGHKRYAHMAALRADGVAVNSIESALESINLVDERCHEAEVYRIKGDIMLRASPNDEGGAQACILQSIKIVQGQHAKGWELPTATSLARLWSRNGKHKEARDLPAPVYNWFTEGFDTQDLKVAKALLQELDENKQ
jgi:predicted ATPase